MHKLAVFILILLSLTACGSATQATPTPAAFIPYVVKLPSVRVFDGTGYERDAAWLREVFGAVTWEGGGLVELHACQGDCPASHVVTVLDAAGGPVEGYSVTWSWPDGSVIGYTDERGMVGFGMGPGAYYTPPAGGPHWVTVNGSRLDGIGMLAATNHEHIDSVWRVP